MASNQSSSKQADPDLAFWQAIMDGGKKRAWGCTQLYQRYSQQLSSLFSRCQLPDDEIEELVQDVFVNLIKGATTFTPDRKFKTWLLAIAHNTLADHLRKKARVEQLDLNDDEILARLAQMGYVSGATHSDRNNALVNCVQQALEQFDLLYPERAFVLQAVVLEGCSYKEMADMLGREVGATGEYISQCRKKLKPFLERCQIYLMGNFS